MAIRLIADGSNWGYTDVTYSGYYHRGDYQAGLICDSVTRSGDTVTIKNIRSSGTVRCHFRGKCSRGCYFGWAASWYARFDLIGTNGQVAKTTRFHQGDYGDYYMSQDQNFSSFNWGDYSFTVGPGDTSKTIKLQCGPQKKSGNSWSTYYPDQKLSFTVTFPKAQRTIKVTAENATFDIAKGTTNVGNNVESYTGTWDYNTAYNITDIKAKPGYYITEKTSDVSGNLTSSKTWVVAKAKKYAGIKITGTNVTFDVKLGNNTVANDKTSYTSTSVAQGTKYYVTDVKKIGADYILDSRNQVSGTMGTTDVNINAGVASPIKFSSSITTKNPIKVTSKCDITIDDKSGRTRNWHFVAKLKQGNTVLATLEATTGTAKTCTLTFNRESTTNVLKVDTNYTVAWTINDKTDSFSQSFTSSSSFSLPCLGYVVTPTSTKKISYFTITDATDAPSNGKVNYSFRRVTRT